ncbi:MAG: hypothetical protein ACLTJG_01580 [[Clostridium] innocuum]
MEIIHALIPMLQEGYKETAKHFIKILDVQIKHGRQSNVFLRD